MEVSDYLSVSRENEVILGRSVLRLTTFFFFVFLFFGIDVIFVFQIPVKYHYIH